MKSVNEKIYFFLNRHGMSKHFSMWKRQRDRETETKRDRERQREG